MNFKDRGNKKWNSLMLVEHQKKLKELKMKQDEVEKPELDSQRLQKINFKVQEALQRNLELKIKFYENKRIKIIKGKILKIKKYKMQIQIKSQDNQIKKLKFDQIIELNL